MAGEDDAQFLYDQARRYVAAKPWEQFARAPLYLDLKTGSWHEVCAQHLCNGPLNALLLFPGRRNMLDLQKAGMAEPPAGTIFVELVDGRSSPEGIQEARQYGWPADLRPIPQFQAIMPGGWLPLERNQARLLALALAAITDFRATSHTDPTTEVTGELALPGATRGRYRARRAPADNENIVPVIGITRNDLYSDGEVHVSFGTISRADYRTLGSMAGLHRPANEPFAEQGAAIPIVSIAGSVDAAADIAKKLTAAGPAGIAFGEIDGVLTAILLGLRESYLLVEAEDGREELMLWWHETRADGAYAIVVSASDSDVPSTVRPESVYAVFEIRTGGKD